jgi:hypothetical protein
VVPGVQEATGALGLATTWVQVLVADPSKLVPGVHEPLIGVADVSGVKVHVVFTKPGLPPTVVPGLQEATVVLLLALRIVQVDVVQELPEVADVVPGVHAGLTKAVVFATLQRVPVNGDVVVL